MLSRDGLAFLGCHAPVRRRHDGRAGDKAKANGSAPCAELVRTPDARQLHVISSKPVATARKLACVIAIGGGVM